MFIQFVHQDSNGKLIELKQKFEIQEDNLKIKVNENMFDILSKEKNWDLLTGSELQFSTECNVIFHQNEKKCKLSLWNNDYKNKQKLKLKDQKNFEYLDDLLQNGIIQGQKTISVTVTITKDNTIVNGAKWDIHEAENHAFLEDDFSSFENDLEFYRSLLDDKWKELTITPCGLSESGRKIFVGEFEKNAPDGYSVENDIEGNSKPWCSPWNYEYKRLWYKPQLTAEQMGKRWAHIVREEMEQMLKQQDNRPMVEDSKTTIAEWMKR